MKLKTLVCFFALASVFCCSNAFAADGATMVFREGQVVRVNYGYKQLIEAFKGLNSKDDNHRIVELTIEGGAFLVDLAQVVIICRDQCSTMEIVDPRASRK